MTINPVLLTVIVRLLIVGILLGLINRYIPMASSIKSLLNGVVVIYMVIWVLQEFGILGPLGGIRLAFIVCPLFPQRLSRSSNLDV